MKSLVNEEFKMTMRELASAAPDGCFVEVGVYQGGTAVVLGEIAKAQERDLFLYDTFEGMPYADEIDTHHVGMFSECDADEIRRLIPRANVIKGVFPDSAVPMPPAAFVHADADQYRSTKAVCEYFRDKMAKGGMILFDDYYCVPSCIAAVDECFPQKTVLPDGRALVTF